MNKENKENKEIIIIKIGTNFIEKTNIKDIVKTILEIRKNNKYVVLISSGAKMFGKKILKNSENFNNISDKEFSAVGQNILMNEYVKNFRRENVNIAQVLVSRKINGSIIKKLLENNILPVINGNDVDLKDDLFFDDNDSLAGEVSKKLNAKRVIIITDVDGVYDSNPRKNKNVKKIKEINKITKKLLNNSKDVGTKNGTGGMYTKLKIAEKNMKNNIETYITSSLNDIKNYIFSKKKILEGTIIKK